MSKVDDLPDGPMKDALREQEAEFAEEMAGRWLDGDADTRADIDAFFESDGPRMVHEAKLKIEDGVPTSADLARLIPRLVYVSPTAETLNLDGVEARVWAGISEGGNPMRLAVHRVFFEPEHEAASVEEFPILQARATPKRFELESAVRLLDEARAAHDRLKSALQEIVSQIVVPVDAFDRFILDTAARALCETTEKPRA